MTSRNVYPLSLLFFLLYVLSASAQIPNPSFEEWEVRDGLENPVGWSTNNISINGEPTLSVLRDSNAFAGNYAMRLIANLPTIEGDCPGEASTFVNLENVVATDTIVLLAWVRCEEVLAPGGCGIQLDLMRNNNIVDRVFWNTGGAVDVYKQVEIPFSIRDLDAVRIKLIGGSAVSPTGCRGSAAFWVDSLALMEQSTSIINPSISLEQVEVFPNPFTNQLNLEVESPEIKYITIYNNLGHTIHQVEVEGQQYLSLNVAQYPKGIYFIKAYDKYNGIKGIQKIVKAN